MSLSLWVSDWIDRETFYRTSHSIEFAFDKSIVYCALSSSSALLMFDCNDFACIQLWKFSGKFSKLGFLENNCTPECVLCMHCSSIAAVSYDVVCESRVLYVWYSVHAMCMPTFNNDNAPQLLLPVFLLKLQNSIHSSIYLQRFIIFGLHFRIHE